METNESIQPNNMMDIFRRQLTNTNETNNINNNSNECQEPISSSTPERHIQVSSDENHSRKVLTFTEHEEQQNGEINNDDDDDDLTLQDNFSFLIAKGMLKPT